MHCKGFFLLFFPLPRRRFLFSCLPRRSPLRTKTGHCEERSAAIQNPKARRFTRRVSFPRHCRGFLFCLAVAGTATLPFLRRQESRVFILPQLAKYDILPTTDETGFAGLNWRTTSHEIRATSHGSRMTNYTPGFAGFN